MFWQPEKLKEWHGQVMDYLILNPRATHEQIAAHFDCHPVTVGMLMRSDIFQARLSERRQMRGLRVDESIITKLDRLAKITIDKQIEKVEKEGMALPMEDLRETAEMAINALGYGTKNSGTIAGNSTAPAQVNIFVGKNDLAEARELMRQKRVKLETPGTVDAEFVPATGTTE